MSEQLLHTTQQILPESIMPPVESRRESHIPDRADSIPTLRTFGQALQAAHDEGQISYYAMKHQGRLMYADVYVDGSRTDPGDRIEQSYMYARGSGREDIKYTIFVPAKDAEDPKAMAREYLRVMAGEERTAGRANRTVSPIIRSGLEQVFGDTAGGKAMNRAVVEHLADSLLYGDIDVIDPAAPARKGAAHVPERSLLHLLATGGERPINIRLFVDAFFEDDAEVLKDSDRSAQAFLTDALAQAFPFTDVIQEISEMEPSKGQSVQQMITKYTASLESRATRPKRLTSRLASMATNHLLKRKFNGKKARHLHKV